MQSNTDWRSITDEREKYQAYLCSREWAEKRTAVYHRAKGNCERCIYGRIDHVHHLTYARKYNEALEDLQALCKGCHDFIHSNSDVDPVLEIPPLWRGRKISSVYLCGKITNTPWRNAIAPDWSVENHGLADFCLSSLSWQTVESACPLPNGRLIALTGPWWRPIEGGGHAVAEDAGCPHSLSVLDSHGNSDYDWAQCHDAYQAISTALLNADLVFAWIDSLDCYGTLFELGLAATFQKTVAIAIDPRVNARELWLARHSATWTQLAKSPKAAWDAFWMEA